MAIIAIDFDGVIVKNKFPSINFVRCTDVIVQIMRLHDMDHEFILWTCREGHHLHDALDWLDGENLLHLFESVNQEPIRMMLETRKFWEKKYRNAYVSRKINADYYVDDKAPGSVEWFLNWDGNDTAGDRQSCSG